MGGKGREREGRREKEGNLSIVGEIEWEINSE